MATKRTLSRIETIRLLDWLKGRHFRDSTDAAAAANQALTINAPEGLVRKLHTAFPGAFVLEYKQAREAAAAERKARGPVAPEITKLLRRLSDVEHRLAYLENQLVVTPPPMVE